MLRVLGHNVKVVTVKDQLRVQDHFGESDHDAGEIRIRGDLESTVYQSTLLHECVHVIDVLLGLEMEEAQVAGVAQGLFAVIRDNPDFLKHIRGKEKR